MDCIQQSSGAPAMLLWERMIKGGKNMNEECRLIRRTCKFISTCKLFQANQQTHQAKAAL
eukprot:1160237-Pelagomonas_calceolata.AAC.11